MTVMAIRLARDSGVAAKDVIRTLARRQYGAGMDRTVDQLRDRFGSSISCTETVPPALICALNADSFEDALRNAVSIGGDSDTLCAIAGPIAESMYGIPESIIQQAKSYLEPEMIELMDRLYKTHAG